MDDHIRADIDALEDLLDAERAALLVGKLDEVSRLQTRKDQLICSVSAHATGDADGVRRLREKVTRNQSLLASALEGLRSVTRRLTEINQVRQSFETYDSHGHRLKVAMRVRGELEKRS